MCTVTYIPKKEKSYILTSSRDESPMRKPSYGPVVKKIRGMNMLMPIDSEANGTWISTTADERTYCLLNGAFERHEKKEWYRKSRGLIFIDMLEVDSIKTFHNKAALEDIEPFMIIAIEKTDLSETRIYDFRWDGKKRFIKVLDPHSAYIWSSTPLYDHHIRKKREYWFEKWLNKNSHPSKEEIMNFHLSGGEGDRENDFYMDRGFVKTVSITQVIYNNRGSVMFHHNLENREKKSCFINHVSDLKRI